MIGFFFIVLLLLDPHIAQQITESSYKWVYFAVIAIDLIVVQAVFRTKKGSTNGR